MPYAENCPEPDTNARYQRIFLLEELSDRFADHSTHAAIAVSRQLGVFAVLRGRVKPKETDDEIFDTRIFATFISFRLPGTSYEQVNIRFTDDRLYGYNLRTPPSEEVLAGLTEEDAEEDEWRRDRLGRTRFSLRLAEITAAAIVREPLLLGTTQLPLPRHDH